MPYKRIDDMSTENFRNDDEFIELIRRSERQSVMLENISKNINDDFKTIKEEIKEIRKEVKIYPTLCANYKPKTNKTFIDMLSQYPTIIKSILIILCGVIAYYLGIDLNF
jgi:predicted  nucleic acid-binding Zn-ribbon protein